MSFFKPPILLSPSNASPAVRAPSPITTIVFSGLCFCSFATEIPSAAESEVLLCPTPKASYLLSDIELKPLKPPYCRKFSNASFRSVNILYA